MIIIINTFTFFKKEIKDRIITKPNIMYIN